MDNKQEQLMAKMRKEAADIAAQVFDEKMKSSQWASFEIPRHVHNGEDAPKISQKDIIPQLRASGSVRMRQTTQYTLNLTFNPANVMFYGNVVHYATPYDSTTIDIRAQVIGSACLGPSYYFQPQTSTSVGSADSPLYNVIQSGSYLLSSESGLTNFTASATEGHVLQVINALGSIVAELTIPNLSTKALQGGRYTDKGYGPGFLLVDAFVEDEWEINGNFVVT